MTDPARLTDGQRKVLSFLTERVGLCGPGYIGGQLWGNDYRKPQHYARTAGKILRALKDKGLAQHRIVDDRSAWGWEITEKGKEALEES